MDCLELIQFQEQSGTHPVPSLLPNVWSLSFAPDVTIIQNYNLSSYLVHLCQVLSSV